MNAFSNNIGKAVTGGVNNQIQNAKVGMNEKSSKVDWEDWNWPPLIRFWHFSLDDCQDEIKP